MSDFTYALMLSLGAGLATGAGSLFSFFVPRTGPIFMSVILGFCSGVMLGVSFLEIIPEALVTVGMAGTVAAFLAGFLGLLLMDMILPHEYKSEHVGNPRLMRTGMMVMVGIALHNLPEGFAVFAGTMQSRHLGLTLAVAVALHNIPEGIAVSVPVFSATGSKKQAFRLSFLSGMAEPLGALLGALILGTLLSPALLGYILSGVAGLMVFISLDELLPAAREYGHEHLVMLGLAAGLVIIAASMVLLG